jgi:hypothetical protein
MTVAQRFQVASLHDRVAWRKNGQGDRFAPQKIKSFCEALFGTGACSKPQGCSRRAEGRSRRRLRTTSFRYSNNSCTLRPHSTRR